ncbi:hypothetical protein AN958_11057 [Leucoagaricus sp. SymC.cos]|nr:hypothetical protein AN958_11057 [Leucoagaricus sp. SymC.cos]
MNTTTKMWHDVVFNDTRIDHLNNSEGGWVDVEDVALEHIRALQKSETGGQWFLLVAGSFYWNEFNESLYLFPLVS